MTIQPICVTMLSLDPMEDLQMEWPWTIQTIWPRKYVQKVHNTTYTAWD